MNLVTSAAGTVASYSPVKIPDIYPVKVARRSLFGDDVHEIRVKTVNNHDEGQGSTKFVERTMIPNLKSMIRKNLVKNLFSR